MTKRILTKNQIEQAKKLRAEDPKRWTKKRLAGMFGVAPTTIYENVFTSEKRHRVYVKARECCYFCCQPLNKHPRCKECGMLLHDDVLKGEDTEEYHCGCGLNHTSRVGEYCVGCYATLNKLDYPNTTHKHTFEELSRIYGKSRESLAQFEKKMHTKILKSKKMVGVLRGTTQYNGFTRRKIKAIEELLQEIPEEFRHRQDELVRIMEEWKEKVEET